MWRLTKVTGHSLGRETPSDLTLGGGSYLPLLGCSTCPAALGLGRPQGGSGRAV